MSKTYILQKDLPDGAKVGDKYLKGEYRYYNERMTAEARGIIESVNWETWQVENNPEWFLQEEKNEYKANFLWGFPDHSVEAMGYEFANAKTEEYQKDCWDTLVKRIQENKSNDSFQWASDKDILEIIHRTFATSDPNHEFVLKRLSEYKTEKHIGFSWSEKLVYELLKKYSWNYVPLNERSWEDAIEKFKQSHTPKPQAEVVAEYHHRPDNKKDFESDVKKAASYYGNNILCEYCGEIGKHKKTCNRPQAENKPDWEIVALEEDGHIFEKSCEVPPEGFGGKIKFTSKTHVGFLTERNIGSPTIKIHSVKRLSDNITFSVGDEVWRNNYKDKIHCFEIGGWGKMKAGFHGGDVIGYFYLEELSKLPPQPTKLFTTFYTQQQVDELCEKAIDGAIRILEEEMSDTGNLDHAMFAFNLRKKLSDYKNSKQ